MSDISGILQRIVGASGHSMSAEAARYSLGMSFTPADLEQIAVLSEKANEGAISPAEQEELRTYVFLNDFLAAMQARARASLLDVKRHERIVEDIVPAKVLVT